MTSRLLLKDNINKYLKIYRHQTPVNCSINCCTYQKTSGKNGLSRRHVITSISRDKLLYDQLIAKANLRSELKCYSLPKLVRKFENGNQTQSNRFQNSETFAAARVALFSIAKVKFCLFEKLYCNYNHLREQYSLILNCINERVLYAFF